MTDERHKDQQHDQEEYRYLEGGLTGLPIESRFLASAQRILYEELNGKAEIRPLWQHQIPAFSSFGDYLLDLATGSESSPISPFCRIILPPVRVKRLLPEGSLTGLAYVQPLWCLLRHWFIRHWKSFVARSLASPWVFTIVK